MKFEFGVISGKTVSDIITRNPESIFDFIRDAYLAHERGQTVNPPSYFFNISEKPNSRIIALPSAITGKNKVVGMKWIGSNPDNIKDAFPRASAAIILNDYDTFYPYVCIEGSIISAVRTAYSAVLAASELMRSNRRIKRMGFVGNGLIARYIYKAFMAQEWDIDDILLFDKDSANSEKFVKYMDVGRHNSIRSVEEINEVLTSTDICVFATSALSPYIHDKNLFLHNPILLNLSLRDLDSAILLHANNVVDDVDHVLKANTSPDLAYRECGNKNFINGTIGEMLMQQNISIDPEKPTVFSPMGMGILDLAVAYFVYQEAKLSGEMMDVPEFFYDIER